MIEARHVAWQSLKTVPLR